MKPYYEEDGIVMENMHALRSRTRATLFVASLTALKPALKYDWWLADNLKFAPHDQPEDLKWEILEHLNPGGKLIWIDTVEDEP